MKTIKKVSLAAVAAMGVMSAANADLKILPSGAPTHKITSDGGPDSLPVGLTGWAASPTNAPTLIAVDAGKYKFEYTGDGDATENNSFSIPPENCVTKNTVTDACSFKNFPHPAPPQSFIASFPAGAIIPWTLVANITPPTFPPATGTPLTNGSTTNVDGASYFLGIDGSSALPPSITQGSAAWIGLSDRPLGVDHDFHDLGVKVSQVQDGPCTLDSPTPNGGPALAPGAPGIVPNECAPVLFPSEQGAFKGLEVATQLVEASILQKGCDVAEYDLNIATNASGKGTVKLDAVVLNVVPGPYGAEGRIYNVNGGGPLGDLSISAVKSTGSYNIGSGIQELTTEFYASSLVSDTSDYFRGTIIKDYVRLSGYYPIPEGFYSSPKKVSTVVDYGYQQIQKNKYVAAKYWQQSQTWRQNGVRAGTWWVKTRVAPEGDCQIVVHLEGTNGKANQDNAQGFNETGSISVNVSDPQGEAGVDYKN